MKKWYQSILMSVLAVSSVGANAKEATKVVVFDQIYVLTQADDAKKMIDKIKNEMKSDQDRLKALGESYNTMKKKLDKEAQVMKAADKAKAEKDMDSKRMELEYLAQKLQKRSQEGEREVFEMMVPKLKEAIDGLVKKKGYDLMIQKQAVLYADSSLDITQEVLQAVNATKGK
jgi:outer membrane protein